MAGSGEFYVQRFEDAGLGDPIGAAALRLFPDDLCRPSAAAPIRSGSRPLR